MASNSSMSNINSRKLKPTTYLQEYLFYKSMFVEYTVG